MIDVEAHMTCCTLSDNKNKQNNTHTGVGGFPLRIGLSLSDYERLERARDTSWNSFYRFLQVGTCSGF